MNAEEIKGLREAMNLSQEVFAAMLGVSRATVKSWESGHKPSAIQSWGLLWLKEQVELKRG